MANTSGKVTYWWYKQQKLWGSGLDYFPKKVQASDLRTPGQVGPKCFSERSALAPANWCATLVWIQEVLHTSVDNLSFFQPKMGHDQLDLLKSHSKGFFTFHPLAKFPTGLWGNIAKPRRSKLRTSPSWSRWLLDTKSLLGRLSPLSLP